MSKSFIKFKKGSIVPQRIAKGKRKTKHLVKFGVDVQAVYREGVWTLTTTDATGSIFRLLSGVKNLHIHNVHIKFANAFEINATFKPGCEYRYE